MLYPQYQDQFEKMLEPETWEYLQKTAKELIAKRGGYLREFQCTFPLEKYCRRSGSIRLLREGRIMKGKITGAHVQSFCPIHRKLEPFILGATVIKDAQGRIISQCIDQFGGKK